MENQPHLFIPKGIILLSTSKDLGAFRIFKTMDSNQQIEWQSLKSSLEGELYTDQTMRALYATDASIYREYPIAVTYPKHEADIVELVSFARKHNLSLIPRAAGTSLAGQVVGPGIVVDVSRYMTRILKLNTNEKWVKVQPGVIRDDLNRYLKPHGLFFGPNTSTANRAMLGGMVGNSSCGSTSIKYGNTRDKLLAARTVLSDGSVAILEQLNEVELREKEKQESLEGNIYRQLKDLLDNPELQEDIRKGFPKPDIHRRNTGYAVDLLIRQKPFTKTGPDLNLCTLLAGSEGTLGLATEITLQVDDLPPEHERLLCPHFNSIDECLQAVQSVMEFQPYACEMMDKKILDCTKEHPVYKEMRHFLQEDPEAVLMIEVRGTTEQQADEYVSKVISRLKKEGFGYAYPILTSDESEDAWTLRKGGLGLLSNMPGDAKAVACIEDTAVDLPDLPGYIRAFREMMSSFNQEAVYYAHAGAGELHLRPVLNLKTVSGQKNLRRISERSAKLVKKFNGSLSGEHGDGRLRAEFIPLVLGDKNQILLQRVKEIWDPQNVFNPGKIVHAPPMDTSLRYKADQTEPNISSVMDFTREGGLLRAIEKCNGSGDCRKLPTSGGVMCPSYMATRHEKDTTRARANILREFYRGESPSLTEKEVGEVLDLCLNCKGCYAECPSHVDMASMKAEFLHQQHEKSSIPWRTRMFLALPTFHRLIHIMPGWLARLLTAPLHIDWMKSIMGISPHRSVPFPEGKNNPFKSYYAGKPGMPATGREVVLFVDEFSEHLEAHITRSAIDVLVRLGYNVQTYTGESGRIPISKGVLDKAKRIAQYHVDNLEGTVQDNKPLVGIEPSAVLTFRDEIPRLAGKKRTSSAQDIADNSLTFEEFLVVEYEQGFIQSKAFSRKVKNVLVHAHCHQKALGEGGVTARLMSIPQNFQVEQLQTGCCGMAGSFGYEKEHYSVSMDIGELVLFPRLRKTNQDDLIIASGTSCRQQILDGTGQLALHPAEALSRALA